MNDADIQILIKARDEASKVIDDVGGSAEKASKGMSTFTKSALGVGAGLAAFGAADIAVGQIKGMISAASDMQETVSKSNTIFGSNAAAIEKWASGGAKDFGLSKQAALENAASFGNMFTQIGIGTEQAAGLSTGMVELAADFASFHNADITEVLGAQQAAFRGEYDALQRFVPTINAANVEQKALQMTGKTLTSELTAQEKALAVNALMMEGAGAAAGDFDKTSGSLANQQRQLSAEWDNMQATLGQALIPIITQLVAVLIPLLTLLAQHQEIVLALAVVIGGVLVAAFVAWAVSAAAAAAATLIAIAPVVAAAAVIAILVAGIILLIANWDAVKEATIRFIEQNKILVGILALPLAPIAALIAIGILLIKNWDDVVAAAQFMGGVVVDIWNTITGVVDVGVSTITGLISGMRDTLAGIWSDVQGAAVGAWNAIKDGIIGVVVDTVNSVLDWFGSLVSSIVGMVNGVIGKVNGAIGAINSALNFTVSFPGFDPPGPGSIPGFSQNVNAGVLPTIGMIGYEKGTPFVPRDMAAYLHKGEAVIPADENQGWGSGMRVYGPFQPIFPNVVNGSEFMRTLDRMAS